MVECFNHEVIRVRMPLGCTEFAHFMELTTVEQMLSEVAVQQLMSGLLYVIQC